MNVIYKIVASERNIPDHVSFTIGDVLRTSLCV